MSLRAQPECGSQAKPQTRGSAQLFPSEIMTRKKYPAATPETSPEYVGNKRQSHKYLQ